jgi:hypothetical protein
LQKKKKKIIGFSEKIFRRQFWQPSSQPKPPPLPTGLPPIRTIRAET